MTILLERALQKVRALPQEEQDAIASQILDSLSDDEAWKSRFASSGDKLRKLAQEAVKEDQQGETRSLDELL